MTFEQGKRVGTVAGKSNLSTITEAQQSSVGKHTLAIGFDSSGKNAAPLAPLPSSGSDTSKDHGKPADGAKASPGSTGHTDTEVVATAGRQAPTLSMSLQRMRTSDIPTTPQAGLAYTTVSGPTNHDPGGFNWVVQWKLSGASPKGGWIVQHVKVTNEISDKAGKTIATGDDPRFGYWEAWQINKGKDVTTYAEGGDTADDTYARPASGVDTKGTIKVIGTAEFYEGLTLPASFKADTSTPAGILPIVRSQPTLSGGTGAISHNLTATWDATGGNTKTKITT